MIRLSTYKWIIWNKQFLPVIICEAEIIRDIFNVHLTRLYSAFILQLRNRTLQNMSKGHYFHHENSWSFYPAMISPSSEHTDHIHSRVLDQKGGQSALAG